MTQSETLPLACPFCGRDALQTGFTGEPGATKPLYGCKARPEVCPAGAFTMTLEQWNRLSPDKPEAEAVPYAWIRDDAFVNNLSRGSRKPEGSGWMPMYRKPVALPSDKLRGLVRKWREHAASDKASDEKYWTRRLRPDWKAEQDCADELEALLSQEPSSGQGQKPVAWLNTKGDARQVVIAERMSPELSRELSESEWTSVPLFASPVTGGEAPASGQDSSKDHHKDPKA